ncbi:hypothetical protein FB561_3657 [Kribbella amoyensis]|uniref:Uncharacterized protein n=1 Tax=Kribbella amoyensis TaxID=996641 RepID=A0A561BUE1_9ACTN|nr:hypothetical protein [Kribbella amoyensis]TWD82524.1 hypothetical protein FB561_3657 [Kribbella amoyensis]
MRRGVVVLDRLIGTIVALVLVALGGLAIAWRYGELPGLGDRIEVYAPADPTGTEWWPWATGTAGVVLVMLGLWWLVRHLPRRVGGRFSLPGGDRSGRLSADAHAAVGAAAATLAQRPEIRDGSGRVVADRGELVAELQCTVEPSADLQDVHTTVSRVVTDLSRVIGLPNLRYRVLLRVARADKTAVQPRVS